jgi:hypothetical protein
MILLVTHLYFYYLTIYILSVLSAVTDAQNNDKLGKPFCKEIFGILSSYLVKRFRRIPYLIKHLYYFSNLPVGISSILMLKNLNY